MSMTSNQLHRSAAEPSSRPSEQASLLTETAEYMGVEGQAPCRIVKCLEERTGRVVNASPSSPAFFGAEAAPETARAGRASSDWSPPPSTVIEHPPGGTTGRSLCSFDIRNECTGQETTDAAALSGKLSAVTAGYYEDPFLTNVVKPGRRCTPIINRGYYTRVAAVRTVYSTFVQCLAAKGFNHAQVVNLGAGLDTLYFWAQTYAPSKSVTVKFFEVDFLQILSKKVSIFTSREPIMKKLQSMQGIRSVASLQKSILCSEPIVVTDTLVFVPADLRNLNAFVETLSRAGFSQSSPTIFLSECALVYLPASSSDQIISWASGVGLKAPAAFFIYEQVNPYDAFGRTMVKNLDARGCPLLGIYDHPSLKSQTQRFLSRGWSKVAICDMNRYFDRFVDKFEVVRIQRLELFDELEEWRLIQGHYFIAVAVKEPLTAQKDVPCPNTCLQLEQPGGATAAAAPVPPPQALDHADAVQDTSCGLGAASLAFATADYYLQRRRHSQKSMPWTSSTSNFRFSGSSDLTNGITQDSPVEEGTTQLEVLEPLANLWSASNEIPEELPRFSTEELRASFSQRQRFYPDASSAESLARACSVGDAEDEDRTEPVSLLKLEVSSLGSFSQIASSPSTSSASINTSLLADSTVSAAVSSLSAALTTARTLGDTSSHQQLLMLPSHGLQPGPLFSLMCPETVSAIVSVTTMERQQLAAGSEVIFDQSFA